MNDWILIAVVAYMLFASNGVIDKILLTNAVRKPWVYAFYNGSLAVVVIFLIPFGVSMLSWPLLILSLFGGACFTYALILYYTSIQQISISRVLPIQGGFVPLFTLALASMLIGERLTASQTLAFAFLTVGAIMISFKKTDGVWKLRGINYSLAAAFFFALHFVISKYVFEASDFLTGLFWTRWGMFLFAACFLFSKSNRQEIHSTQSKAGSGNKALFFTARGAGGLAGILQNYAISLGSVTIVNALQSVQFVFVLVLTSFLSVKFPKLLKETITAGIVLQKLTAIILVVLGLTILSYTT
jgi:drug/metabolite transporter (DMT)-like permease